MKLGTLSLSAPSKELPKCKFGHYDQGDKIGKIFAHWAIVDFGEFLENCRSSPNFVLLFLW
jgi:hypothetical protein